MAGIPILMVEYLIDSHTMALILICSSICLAWYWLGFLVCDSDVDSFLFRKVGVTIMFVTVILALIIAFIGLRTVWQYI